MDKFVVDVDENENLNLKSIPPALTREHKIRIRLDIKRFYETGIPFNVARSLLWINMLHQLETKVRIYNFLAYMKCEYDC